jgi:hypothetical protein
VTEAADNLVGLAGERFDLVVERGKIREFARATHAQHDAYFDAAAPPIPPTFLAAAALWAPYEEALWDRAGRNAQRALHAEQEFIFPGPPPRAGTKLAGYPRIEDIYHRQGRRGGSLRFIVLVTEFKDDAGNTVAVSRSTAVETETPPEEE